MWIVKHKGSALLTLVCMCSLISLAEGASWQGLLDRAELLVEQGAADSANVLVDEAISQALSVYGFSDTAAVVLTEREGISTEYYFRNFEEAETLFTRALSIRERATGRRTPEYARLLNDLAEVYRCSRRFEAADSLHNEALSIREEHFGPESLEAAESLANLTKVYEHQGRHADAESVCRRALAIRETAHGEAHPEIAYSLVRLAWTHWAQGEPAEAESLARRALAVCEEALGPDDEVLLIYLNPMTTFCQNLGKYAETESLCIRALEICDKAFGPEQRQAVLWWYKLASVRKTMGLYPDALQAAKRALAIEERAYGPEHYSLSGKLLLMGQIYYDLGRYAEAEPLVKRGMTLWEAHFGPEHAHLAYFLNTLGILLVYQGRYGEAEPLYRRAMALWEKRYGPDHQLVASTALNLANVYINRRMYEDAEPLYKRALDIWEKALGPDNPRVASGLSAWAEVYSQRGDYAEAERLYLRARAIREAALGRDHPDVAMSATNLGSVYRNQGRYAEAETLYTEAVAIWETALGPEHPSVASGLENLAKLHYELGQYAQAETLYVRALAIEEKALGQEHEDVAWVLEAMCDLYRAQGRTGEAVELAARAAGIRQKNFNDNALVLAEKDAMAFSYHLRESVDNYLTCYFESESGDPEALLQALDILFSSKGKVSDGVFERRKALADETDSATVALAEALRYAKFQLSQVFVEGPGEDLEGYRSKVDSLYTSARDLEADLARRSASFRKKQDYKDISTRRIASLLPENSSLVDYIRYNHKELRPERSVARYITAMLPPDGEPMIIELGEASEIDALVEAWRSHMMQVVSSGNLPNIVDREQYERLSRDLYERMWRPVEPRVEDTEVVLVAPDGALNMVALAGLKADDGKYLTEKYTLHHLSAGRDLVRLDYEVEPAMGLFALGDPDYGASVTNRLAAVEAPKDSSIEVAFATRNVRSSCGELSETEITPLPGTRREVELISKGWQETTFEPLVTCYGDEASEEVFKAEALGKRIIHLATHGYFLGGACRPEEAGMDYVGENPLLLSGLFFAGANLHGEGADSVGAEDGILTAYEVSAMDLRGTELVVLSACETGLGEVAEGEGVYGLRRAFQMAGARTVVSALWPVSDEATAEMMSQLYERQNESIPQTMRRIQLDRINELRQEGKPDHPFTWGAFIALGDWR